MVLDDGGHAEIVYDNVRVPQENLLGELHDSFAMAQARLGPVRIHYAMRLIGMAARAFDLMCKRSADPLPVRKQIAEQGVFQDWITDADPHRAGATARPEDHMDDDTVGDKGAAVEISAIKVAAPEIATWVIDRAIQAFGGMGVSQDTPLAEMYEQARMLRITDGPDEVHKMALASESSSGTALRCDP